MSWQIGAGYEAHLSARTGHSYASYGFDENYFLELAELMGIDLARLDKERFAVDHFNLVYAYLQGVHHEDIQVSITRENRELAKLQKLTGDLGQRLCQVAWSGQAGDRLREEIDALPETREAVPNLKSMIGQDLLHPFQGVTDLLDQLYVALERAKIQKPTPDERPFPDEGDTLFGQTHREKLLRNRARRSQGDDPERHYRERVAAYGLHRNHAIALFAEEFQTLWADYSPLPFTEGKYEPDAHQHISRTVDAAEMILRQMGVKCPRSLVENKVKEARVNSRQDG